MTAWERQVQAGLVAFNAGDFFAAHEEWEEAWKTSAGARKTLLGGMIQLAAGLHQAGRGKREGATRLLARAAERFVLLPSELEGFDVDELESFARSGAQVLSDGGEAPVLRMTRSTEGTLTADAEAPLEASCPYCGETVDVSVDPGGPASESYVEDCSVCCRPWRVEVERSPPNAPTVTLHRDSE